MDPETDYTPIETRVIPNRYGGKDHDIHRAEVPGQEAIAALAFIEKWGMVAGMPDGEDSAGRARLRLATPEEVVDRAIAITELAFSRFRAKGWLVRCPLPIVEAERKAE